MKCGWKYDFIIFFIQFISVFHAGQAPVYLSSIFAESFFAVIVGFLSSAFLIFYLFILFLGFLQTAVMSFDFCFYDNCKSHKVSSSPYQRGTFLNINLEAIKIQKDLILVGPDS